MSTNKPSPAVLEIAFLYFEKVFQNLNFCELKIVASMQSM